LVALAANQEPLLSGLFLFVIGSAHMMGYAQSQTLVQEAVSDDMRGRVLALLTLTTAGVGALGSMLAASLAALVGVNATFVLGGLACAGAAVLMWLASDSLRRRAA